MAANPHSNLEFKCKLDDLARIEAALRRIGAVYAGQLVQRDTYFRVPQGRLKLREMPHAAELIEYSRDERAPAMMSRYTRTPVERPAALIADLTEKHGQRGTVEKTRMLWRHGTARIHLDNVAGLGSYIEIEVVDPRTTEDGQALLDELITELSLDSDKAVRASYIDLLEAATTGG